MNDVPGTKRNFKDNAFRRWFSDSGRFRDVCGALRGSSFGEDAAMENITLEDALLYGKVNDVSFLIDNRLIVLIEHQSTVNYNMPLRMLMYAGRLYEKVVDSRRAYRDAMIDIPEIELYVLYNGTKKFPKSKILKLSDMMYRRREKKYPLTLELRVKIYNINNGCNPELMKKSKALYEYQTFMDLERKHYNITDDKDKAKFLAIAECQKRGIIKEFIKTFAPEAENMIFTEWDIDVAKEVWREEAWEEGWEKGMEKGRGEGREDVFALLEKGISLEEAKVMLCQTPLPRRRKI
jgi:hypothetical protein